MPLTHQPKKYKDISDLQAYTMASQDPNDAKFEALESRLESCLKDKLRALFAEFKIGQPSSPTKSHRGESSDRPLEKEGQPSDILQPCMRVDFPSLWEGDPAWWITCVEHYFRYYRTSDDAMVEITVIHLEGDAIQWHNWLEYNHGAPTWNQFKKALLNRFGPTRKNLANLYNSRVPNQV
ncbi:hypothetical protein BHE74_00048858 [Ensete ventricosum]|nr:hypothetical protein BHE74_00048858 [Ensete ventricosum]RZS06900.1 hypothetical protein BHM03_00037605 [Ensete ventricosum]